ncbi:MAG TPA: sugar kinase, partial [Marmoricola sp.]|nr:sugar kinase [Marmoricola sp.]
HADAGSARVDRVDPIEVVTIGETMVQLVPKGERLQDAAFLHVGIGGAESNLASYLAAAGRAVSWVSAVGDDPLGRRMLEDIASYGVDVSGVRVDRYAPTGIYFKDPDGSGATAVYYYRRASAASCLSAGSIDLPELSTVRVVHMSGITMALSRDCAGLVRDVRTRAKAADALFSFDVNYRPALWPVEQAGPELLAQARASDVVFVGLDEANTLWGCASPGDVHELMPSTRVVVKDGAVGATSYAPDRPDADAFVPARPTEVVEAVGAGDAFAAGYLHALLADAPEHVRLDVGHRFAEVALRSIHDVATPDEVRVAVAGLDLTRPPLRR